jgi:hypothetical protein
VSFLIFLLLLNFVIFTIILDLLFILLLTFLFEYTYSWTKSIFNNISSTNNWPWYNLNCWFSYSLILLSWIFYFDQSMMIMLIYLLTRFTQIIINAYTTFISDTNNRINSTYITFNILMNKIIFFINLSNLFKLLFRVLFYFFNEILFFGDRLLQKLLCNLRLFISWIT